MSPPFLLGLLAATVVTAVVAGSYPSLLLSSLRPASVFRVGASKRGRSPLLRRLLVTVQFGLSIILLVMMAVVYRQIDFMRTKALGFDQEKLIYIPLRGDTPGVLSGPQGGAPPKPAHPRRDRNEPGPHLHLRQCVGSGVGGEGPGEQGPHRRHQADFDYPETLGIAMAAGRTFRREYETDEGGAFLVNEEVARLMGLSPQDAVGKPFTFQGIRGGRSSE